MSKEIKDYLHLYIGQKCQLQGDDHVKTFHLTAYNYNYYRQWHNEIKPVLRDLSDMSEEEKEEFGKFTEEHWPKRTDGVSERLIPSKERGARWAAAQTKWYCDKGFDLFGLLPAGLAINAKDLKQ